MDWANERYVRLYTRDTADDLVLSWQAQGLWPLLLRKADRAGVIATNHGPRGIAALVRWPAEVTGSAFAELLEDGRIRACTDPAGYVIPNYLDANETPSSDAQRKRDERERRREDANNSVTKRDAGVTKRDEMSRPSHAESRAVTPDRSGPSGPDLAVPNQEREVGAKPPPARGRKVKPMDYTPEELDAAAYVLDLLSERSGIAYRGSAKHTALLVARLRDGCSRWDLRRVVAYCADQLKWQDKPEMRPYLRPETLFGPQSIEKYLDPARTYLPGPEPTAQPRLHLLTGGTDHG